MKPHLFVAGIIYVTALAACVHTKRVTIATSNNGTYRKLEYSGDVAFDSKDKVVISMSPNARVEYKENGMKLNVDCDESGHIFYKLNGGDKTPQPTAEEQTILSRAALLFAEYKAKKS